MEMKFFTPDISVTVHTPCPPSYLCSAKVPIVRASCD